jgi:hypothetical protein
MKRFLILFILAITGYCLAADVYPHQPALNAAHNGLMAARRRLDRINVVGGTPPAKALNEVVVALNAARKNLDDAAKNKGSHRKAAMDKIDKAKEWIEKLRQGSGGVSKVQEEVDAALIDVKEAARAGQK